MLALDVSVNRAHREVESMLEFCRWGLLLALLGSAPEEKPAPLADVYEIAQVDGSRVGVLHTTIVRHDKDGKQLLATATLDLTLKRYGSVVRLRREEGSIETPEGKVLAVFLRQGQAGGRQLLLTGVVRNDKLHVKIDGGRLERQLDWSDDVIGLRQQERLFATRKPRPGDKFTFLRFEPTYNNVLTVRAEVKDREKVDLLGTKKSLLRVELTPDKLTAPGQTVLPPKSVVWLDDDFVPVRRQIEMDGLGTMILTRTTREKALIGDTKPGADVGARSLIPLNKAIPRPYDTQSIRYRVTVKGDDDPATMLARDDHQEVLDVKGNTFDLLVHPARIAGKGEKSRIGGEYLASCRYIDCNNATIEELAHRAVGAEKDPWKKSLRIERWVKAALRTDNTAALGPASAAAKSLRGDCRHHALLTAALCRAEGIPSRTAIGLLYVYKGGPVLGFHMWTEVAIDGRWLGLDSTLGKGGVSAAHVKITDHSWDKVESLTPLLPVARVLGRVRFEVIRVEK
jgi:transglutaminase-like putative cysteine protease